MLRARSALIGVPFGLIAAAVVPAGHLAYSLLVLLTAISLAAVPDPRLGIPLRSGLLAAAGLVASHSIAAGLLRVLDMVLGGLIGYLAVLAIAALSTSLARDNLPVTARAPALQEHTRQAHAGSG